MGKKTIEIGITGGIGSGKSTICKVFSQLGVPIYDADTSAKWLLNNNSIIKERITAVFGLDSYSPDGVYNSKFIASIVFNNSENVNILNSIVHPEVGRDYKKWVKYSCSKTGYILKEAALMFEAESYKMLDKIINVEAPEEVRIQRIQKRDPFRKSEQIRGIIQKQWTDDRRRKLSDFIITNDDRTLVVPQVLKLHETFIELYQNQ
jgi:dephospho-CoA kinase